MPSARLTLLSRRQVLGQRDLDPRPATLVRAQDGQNEFHRLPRLARGDRVSPLLQRLDEFPDGRLPAHARVPFVGQVRTLYDAALVTAGNFNG
jgi:hypothetical protein